MSSGILERVPPATPAAPAARPAPPRSAGEPTAGSHLEAERAYLWGLCYRMTGSAADAEDLVQETFVRAIERPPPDRSLPWRPWLTRVAMNLSTDALRKRRRRSYPGTWLPEPVETAPGEGPEAGPVPVLGLEGSPEARYSAAESATFAFLVAAEALTPGQRAVLMLRDVLDLSVAETSRALEMSEANVKTTLHRARAAMQRYDTDRVSPNPALAARVREMLGQLMVSFSTGRTDEARALLSADVRALSDGGGLTFAAGRPVVGAGRVAKMYVKLASRSSDEARVEVREINGMPALVLDDPHPKSPNARRAVVLVDLDREGRVRAIHSVLSPPKLYGIRPAAA